ncbi:MAG: FAD-dependent oxidoreductase [Pseudomonadota bacterium]
MTQRLVIIGNGMVGLRFLENLLEAAPNLYEITVIGAEPRAAYNRVLLSPFLAGEIAADDVAMKPTSWYAENKVDLRLGQRAKTLDAKSKSITLDSGDTLSFDICVLATGSKPIRLPIPGADQLKGVHTFRDFDDVTTFRSVAQSGRPAVVIGGGLLGIETAYGLARAGVEVHLVHLMDRLMERQLDAQGGAILKSALEERGIEVHLEAATEVILDDGQGSVSGVRLRDGKQIPGDIVVMAVGVQANTDLAKEASLDVGRGIKVSDTLETSAPGVFALGECAEHLGVCYGLVEPGYDQALVLAHHLADQPTLYAGNVLSTNLKVSGVPVFSAGDFSGDDTHSVITQDEAHKSYRRLFVKDNNLVGVVLVGDTADALWYRDLIAERTDISPFKDALAFGPAFANAA